MDDKQAAEVLREMKKDISRAMDAIGERGGWMTGETEYYRPCLVPLQRGADALEMLEWMFAPNKPRSGRATVTQLYDNWLHENRSGPFRAFCEARFKESKKGLTKC